MAEFGVRESPICAATASRGEAGVSAVAGERAGGYLKVKEQAREQKAEGAAAAAAAAAPAFGPPTAAAAAAAEAAPKPKPAPFRPRGAPLAAALVSHAQAQAGGKAEVKAARKAANRGCRTGAKAVARVDRTVKEMVKQIGLTRGGAAGGAGRQRAAAASKGPAVQDKTVSSAGLAGMEKIKQRSLPLLKVIAELQFRGCEVADDTAAPELKALLQQHCAVKVSGGCTGYFQWTMPAALQQKHDSAEAVRRLKTLPELMEAAQTHAIECTGLMEDKRTQIIRHIMGAIG